jgi:DNA-binding GntR family transcriptional regulator
LLRSSSLGTDGPIDFGGLSEVVSNRLRQAILSGQLKDGQRVVERTIAAELGVSRGPIRDALKTLEAEGLVALSPRRGARIATLTIEDAAECIAIREGIEPIAVRFLIGNSASRGLEALENVVYKLDEAATRDDWSGVVLLDMEFHEAIYRHAGQRRLQRIWDGLRAPLLQTFRLHRQFYSSITEVPFRHRQLLDTIRRGSLVEAEAAIRAHVIEFRPQLLAAMKST